MPGKIQPLKGRPFTYTFEPEDAQAIDEMIGYLGESREEIIIKALSLLYTIYTERPSAKTVIVQDASGRTVVSL